MNADRPEERIMGPSIITTTAAREHGRDLRETAVNRRFGRRGS